MWKYQVTKNGKLRLDKVGCVWKIINCSCPVDIQFFINCCKSCFGLTRLESRKVWTLIFEIVFQPDMLWILVDLLIDIFLYLLMKDILKKSGWSVRSRSNRMECSQQNKIISRNEPYLKWNQVFDVCLIHFNLESPSVKKCKD